MGCGCKDKRPPVVLNPKPTNNEIKLELDGEVKTTTDSTGTDE